MTFGAHLAHRERQVVVGDVPVVPSDNDSAGTSLFPLLDIVNIIEALPRISNLKLLSQIIVADTSGEHYGFWWEDVLEIGLVIRMQTEPDSVTDTHCSTTSGVLRSSPSDIGHFVILHDFVVAIT